MTFQTEVEAGDRSCDILVEGNIVIEVDGDVHTENTQSLMRTIGRNYMKIFMGFRLIVVKIDDYHKSGRELKELLKRRLEMMKNDPEIIMIE